MIKNFKILFTIFILAITLSGCNALLFQSSSNNSSYSEYADKKNSPANTDPWKNNNKRFKKKHSSKWDHTKKNRTASTSPWRKTYKERSQLPNYNRKGLNKSTMRTDGDPNPVNALSAGFAIGPTNSLTDVGGSDKSRPLFLDMQLAHTRLNFSTFARYKFTNKWTGSAWLTFGNLTASDANSKSRIRASRGYSFTNRVVELSLRPEFNFPYLIVKKRNSGYITTFDSYVFTGLNTFFHSPNFTSSTPISSEYTSGYKKVQLAIPLGAGCYFSFPSRLKLGFDIAFRKSFFDHLDGVTRPGSRAPDYYVFANFNIHYTFRVSTLFKKDNNFFKPKLNRKKEKQSEFKRRESIFFR